MRIDTHKPSDGRVVHARLGVVQVRLLVFVVAGKTLRGLRPTGYRTARHRQAERIVVIGLLDRTIAADHNARAAQMIGDIVARSSVVRVAADDTARRGQNVPDRTRRGLAEQPCAHPVIQPKILPGTPAHMIVVTMTGEVVAVIGDRLGAPSRSADNLVARVPGVLPDCPLVVELLGMGQITTGIIVVD